MKRVFIIHRWSGTPNEDWLPWLKIELETRGYEVIAPSMPNSDNPVIEEWVGHLAALVGIPDKDTFFIGHSIGCQTILRYLDSYAFEPLAVVGGAVFVAGWFNLDNMETDEEKKIAEPWIVRHISSTKIHAVLPKSTLIISSDDPYGCLKENKDKFTELGSKIIELPNAGHIMADNGFTKLPEALDQLLKMTE